RRESTVTVDEGNLSGAQRRDVDLAPDTVAAVLVDALEETVAWRLAESSHQARRPERLLSDQAVHHFLIGAIGRGHGRAPMYLGTLLSVPQAGPSRKQR